MYHRFPPASRETLRRQCEHIRRHYSSVSLSQVAESPEASEPLPSNALAVTVDDGFRDFLENAFPIFRDYDIPVTVFLATDFIDGKLWLWTDQVDYLTRRSARDSVEVGLRGNRPPLRLPLATEAERVAALSKLWEVMIQLPDLERRELLAALPGVMGVELPVSPPPRSMPLTWEEVRRLAHGKIEFGAHTKTHPILSRIADDAELREEVAGSKARIEEELGQPVIHFCYPNGSTADFNSQSVQVVSESGFRTAVTTERGLNWSDWDRFRLRRVPVDSDYAEPRYRELLAGMHARG